MRILHAFNQHRGGGGADNAARATIAVSRSHGLEVEVFTRSSEDLPRTLRGRWQAGTSVVYAPDSVKRFTALLDSFSPDVVHLHEVFPLVSPWILPPTTRRGVPVVLTCVDYRMTCPVVTHLRDGQLCTLCTRGNEHWVVLKNCRQSFTESLSVALYNTVVRRFRLFHDRVDMFIAPSDFTREWLIEHAGIDPARITTVSPLVEIPETPADAAAGGYVAFAGRFTPEKGVSTFLAAAELCPLPFAMARNEHAFATVPVPPAVEVVVTRGRDDLAAFYRGARLLVVPSMGLETFGLVGAEAMSHGIPVVASRLGALTNLVEDGADGLLFEPGNARDLAEKVTRLWDDPDLCRRLGRAAREKAASLWSANRHFQRTMALYERL